MTNIPAHWTNDESRNIDRKQETDTLRERSGHIEMDSKLVAFLYELMRDHLPPGVVERLVQDSQISECLYTNGWLAKYAEDLANRLK
jgi:hypothetical protein